MASGSIARRYARALMEIGLDSKRYEALGREVGDLARAYARSEELADTLSNPAFPRADRRKVLKAVLERLGASPTTHNFCLLLLDRERLGALPDISRELSAMIDEHIGRIGAEVTSATPLSPMQEGHLKRVLEKLTGKTVIIDKREDPALLGGVIAKVGDLVYDGSLRTQLDRIRDSLVK